MVVAVSEWERLFRGRLRGRLLVGERLCNHVSFRVGGPADLLFFPADGDDLGEALRLAAGHRVPVFVMGNGTNLVVKDGGVRGLTIHLTSLEGIRPPSAPLASAEGQEVEVSALAGTPLSRVINYSVSQGLSGLEFAAGIPGTVGGALFMNAGAHGSSFGDIVTWVQFLDYGGEKFRAEGAEIDFFYRGSRFPKEGIVVEVGMKLVSRGEVHVLEKVKTCLSEREKRLPFGVGMAGSIFKNPLGDFAGRLIESLGLKGLRIGQAEVSRKHAHVIVNLGGARAADILRLVEIVTGRVEKETGIRLEPEIEIVGEERRSRLRP